MAAAPAAGAGPELGLTAALIFLAIGWCVLWGLQHGYESTFGALLRFLADHLHVDVWFIHFDLGGEVEKVDHWIKSRIADGMHHVEHAMAVVVEWMEWTFRRMVDVFWWFVHQNVYAFDNLVHGTIPQAIHHATSPLTHWLSSVEHRITHEAARLERSLVHKAHALELELEHDFGKAWRGIDHLRTTLEAMLAHWAHVLGARVGALADYVYHGLTARVRLLEELLAGGAIAAIAIEAMTRVWPWWKCSNVNKAMKGLCRMNSSLLDLLLGGTIEAFLVSDLCDFIWALSGTAKAAEPALLAFVQVEDVLIGCHGFTRPPALPLPPLDFPPVTGYPKLPAAA